MLSLLQFPRVDPRNAEYNRDEQAFPSDACAKSKVDAFLDPDVQR